ncbi:glucosaminidase domain-containing protein [Stenotrophomonas rhizophila]|uniref:glucosaminidase domain-containing protein n=1 Tax=Stenotrophomonas rhizophila TaxID=216778 RepID=UPI001E42B452|nr:glucosaminidase domain-containing protein [Stenotrophomonas rhizophila]MCC7635302.1 flagellar assembly peptidoglycan hydrolase FlgJ [Stenotrophomonas rhizophila]MCC7663177.1 flagellar assembly peptidoglycan hydrolase FlgJ [Stenotrophomonas rhizophila]
MRITPALELNPAQANSPAKVDKVARQLEGQFAQMLVKSMRDASFGDALFPAENTMFREMYDKQIAEAMTRGRGLGLSAMITRQLGGAQAEAATPTDTALNPAAALRAYRLNAPAAAPMALPGATAPAGANSEVEMLQQLRGADPSAVLQPMERALDLIAGRESSQMHEAIGRSDPYAAAPGVNDPSRENWAALANDRWSGVNDGAAARGPSAVDTLAANTAAAKLGPHTPEGFVASIWGHAQQAARELGVDAKALVAQAALETGWGRKLVQRNGGGSSHNLFGIKANGWNGERARSGTHEYVDGVRRNETASFRAYGSVGDSFADYVKLLKNSPRYQNALQAGSDVRGFAQGLQKAGYATDPGYAAKIAAIAGGPTIERAIAAVGDASQRLGQTFASTASPTGLGAIRR